MAGVVLLIGSVFDALDGIVARSRGAASDAGEMLDATVDRYADALGFIGLAIFYREAPWRLAVVLLAIVGAMMVSYVRAKADALGVALAPGLMRRPERIAYLSFGLFARPSSLGVDCAVRSDASGHAAHRRHDRRPVQHRRASIAHPDPRAASRPACAR